MTAPRRPHGPDRDSRQDRFPPPHAGEWCAEARDDPITGLIAWPGFFASLPGIVEQTLTEGRPVGLAIGDVDNLKEYVEGVKAVDAQSFGHLAGNALMGRLGVLARLWLWTDGPSRACLATFGGDEIVLLAETSSTDGFISGVVALRDQLCRGLPRTVSFGAAVVSPGDVPAAIVGEHWWREYVVYVIGLIERRLFEGKRARRQDGSHEDGFVLSTQIDATNRVNGQALS